MMRTGIVASAVFLVGCNGEPEPSGTVIAPINIMHDLAVNANALYWTDGSGVSKFSLPAGTGSAVKLVSGQIESTALALDGTSIYFTNQGTYNKYDGSVMKVAFDGSGLTTLADRLFVPHGIAVDANNVYWSSGNCVCKVPLNGGSFVALVFGIQADAITSDVSYVYYSDVTHGGIWRVAIGGGSPTLMVQADAQDLAVDATSLYWTTLTAPGTTNKVDLAGGPPITLATEHGISNIGDASHAIAIDNGKVYWTTTHAVERAGLDGSMGEILTNFEKDVVGLAIDTTSVYWGTGGGELKVISK